MAPPPTSPSSLIARRRPDLASLDLEPPLTRALDEARLAFPTLPLDPDGFALHVAEHLPGAAEAPAFFATLHAADLYLAYACSQRVEPALRELDRVHLARLPHRIAAMDPSPDFIDEVRQRLRERLLVGTRPRIVDYTGQGSLEAWVRVAATRLALNLVRSRRRELAARLRGASDGEATALPAPSEPLDTRLRGQLEEAFRVALRQLDPEERRLLRRYYVERTSQEELARHAGIGRTTVIRQLAASRARVLQLTHHELQRRVPALTTSARESLFRALRSHMQVDLLSALRSLTHSERQCRSISDSLRREDQDAVIAQERSCVSRPPSHSLRRPQTSSSFSSLPTISTRSGLSRRWKRRAPRRCARGGCPRSR
jgi:RNA polymerase sigma-70 factor (ECF subfamily)